MGVKLHGRSGQIQFDIDSKHTSSQKSETNGGEKKGGSLNKDELKNFGKGLPETLKQKPKPLVVQLKAKAGEDPITKTQYAPSPAFSASAETKKRQE